MLPLRPYTPLKMVLCVCGECFREDPNRRIDYQKDILQGNLVLMDGKVYLLRYCQRGHGQVMSLYEEDHDLWNGLQQWRVPTKQIIPDAPQNYQPIPMNYLNGLGDLQTQHSCILLLDVTEACNLNCPTCFADSGTQINKYARTDHLLRALDNVLEREAGRIDVLMLSGGEPTVHPDIIEIIKEATARNVIRVVLNTNGIRIAKDDKFMDALAKLHNRVEVYLQFDGFSLNTHLHHRGEDLRAIKTTALDRLMKARIFTTLVMTVSADVNDGEIGDVARYALDTDYVAGVAYQPVFGSGRAQAIDPMHRVTTTGVLQRLGQQTNDLVGPQDFIGLPCSHPDCCAITYFVRGDDGQINSVPKLLGTERMKANLGLAANSITFPGANQALQTALLGMMSGTMTVTRPELIDYVWNLCENCDLGLKQFVQQVASTVLKRESAEEIILKRIKRFTIKSFMDAYTLNVERLQQCCVHVGSTAGDQETVRIPFCARQLFSELHERTALGQISNTELLALTRTGGRRQ